MSKARKSSIMSHLICVRKDVILNVNDIDSIVITNKDQKGVVHDDKTWYKVNMIKNRSPYDYVLLTPEEYEKYINQYL